MWIDQYQLNVDADVNDFFKYILECFKITMELYFGLAKLISIHFCSNKNILIMAYLIYRLYI